MRAIKECFEALRIHHGWGIAEVAQQLGVHYETARRLRAGEIKEPSFTLVAGLHKLAERSLDSWVEISPEAAGGGSPQLEDRVREMVVDQLSSMLAHGLTLQLPGGGDSGMLAPRPRPQPGNWTVTNESRLAEDALLKAGRLLGEEQAAEPEIIEPQLKRRAAQRGPGARSVANGRTSR